MSIEIRSEERGFHWVAWVASAKGDKPAGAVLMVGKTRDEAETRAREVLAPLVSLDTRAAS